MQCIWWKNCFLKVDNFEKLFKLRLDCSFSFIITTFYLNYLRLLLSIITWRLLPLFELEFRPHSDMSFSATSPGFVEGYWNILLLHGQVGWNSDYTQESSYMDDLANLNRQNLAFTIQSFRQDPSNLLRWRVL